MGIINIHSFTGDPPFQINTFNTLLFLIVGGSNKMELRAKSKNNASKTKKCIGEGHKKVQNQENDPPTIRHKRVKLIQLNVSPNEQNLKIMRQKQRNVLEKVTKKSKIRKMTHPFN